jgi:hypothetical protein
MATEAATAETASSIIQSQAAVGYWLLGCSGLIIGAVVLGTKLGWHPAIASLLMQSVCKVELRG